MGLTEGKRRQSCLYRCVLICAALSLTSCAVFILLYDSKFLTSISMDKEEFYKPLLVDDNTLDIILPPDLSEFLHLRSASLGHIPTSIPAAAVPLWNNTRQSLSIGHTELSPVVPTYLCVKVYEWLQSYPMTLYLSPTGHHIDFEEKLYDIRISDYYYQIVKRRSNETQVFVIVHDIKLVRSKHCPSFVTLSFVTRNTSSRTYDVKTLKLLIKPHDYPRAASKILHFYRYIYDTVMPERSDHLITYSIYASSAKIYSNATFRQNVIRYLSNGSSKSKSDAMIHKLPYGELNRKMLRKNFSLGEWPELGALELVPDVWTLHKMAPHRAWTEMNSSQKSLFVRNLAKTSPVVLWTAALIYHSDIHMKNILVKSTNSPLMGSLFSIDFDYFCDHLHKERSTGTIAITSPILEMIRINKTLFAEFKEDLESTIPMRFISSDHTRRIDEMVLSVCPSWNWGLIETRAMRWHKKTDRIQVLWESRIRSDIRNSMKFMHPRRSDIQNLGRTVARLAGKWTDDPLFVTRMNALCLQMDLQGYGGHKKKNVFERVIQILQTHPSESSLDMRKDLSHVRKSHSESRQFSLKFIDCACRVFRRPFRWDYPCRTFGY